MYTDAEIGGKFPEKDCEEIDCLQFEVNGARGGFAKLQMT
jgi:hypothetical protein